MREIKFGETVVGVKASPLTPFLYKKDFGTDILADLMSMEGIERNPLDFDMVLILQIAYALAKTAAYGKDFPNFEGWLASLDSVDFADPHFTEEIMEEAMQGLFRSSQEKKQKTKQ